MKTIAVIGGGFSGTMAAVNLVRLSRRPLRVLLVNHKHPLGRGVAYGTKCEEHLLNVAARNMSAVPDHPNHFLDWLRTRVEYRDLPEAQVRETFVPRRVYGDYLCSLLLNYLSPIDDHRPAGISVIEDEAVDIAVHDDQSAEVILRTGGTHRVDRVLIATGNQPPAPLPSSAGLLSHPAYCADPWDDWQNRIPDASTDIVVLGTGLTMVDVFLTLGQLGWSGNLIAVSRNGMIPNPHFQGSEYPDFPPEEPENLGLNQLAALLQDHCDRLRRLGENPGIVVDRLRPHTQRIWERFSIAEKREFLNRYAARWNVIRHRIARPVHQRLISAISEGRVNICRGTVTCLSDQGARVLVRFRNPAGEEKTVAGDLVINCTGPQSAFSTTAVPLFRNLLERGLIRPDEIDMGIDVSPRFAVVDRKGEHSEFLFAIGPLLKGTLWETIAVPELRGQAMRVAQLLVADVATAEPGYDYRFSVEEEQVIEYYI